jgi:AraC family transcriptional regulator
MNDFYAVVEGRFGAVEVRGISHTLTHHAHANWQMQYGYWIEGGTAHAQIGDVSAPYSEDFVVGINRYESHDFTLDDPNTSAVILELSLQQPWLDEVQAELGHPLVHAAPSMASSPEIHKAALQLMQSVQAPQLLDARTLEVAVIHLLRLTLHKASQTVRPLLLPQRRKLIDYRLRLALEYMQDPSVNVHSITEVAKRVGLSRSRLYELFQRELKSSPQVTWKSIRMLRTLQMMDGGGEDLAEVALKLGFSSAGNFTRYFRGVMGVTPSAYRKAQLKKRFNERR